MATKKSSTRTKSSKFDAFNRSQKIYKLLEKGILESEALSSGAADRPEDDAHLQQLLEQAGETTQAGEREVQRSVSKSTPSRSKSSSKPSKNKIKRKQQPGSSPKIKNIKRKYVR